VDLQIITWYFLLQLDWLLLSGSLLTGSIPITCKIHIYENELHYCIACKHKDIDLIKVQELVDYPMKTAPKTTPEIVI
jgi:hypothetical protein